MPWHDSGLNSKAETVMPRHDLRESTRGHGRAWCNLSRFCGLGASAVSCAFPGRDHRPARTNL